MTILRQRMVRDMQLRRLADKTQESYLWAVTGLAKYYKPQLCAKGAIPGHPVFLNLDENE